MNCNKRYRQIILCLIFLVGMFFQSQAQVLKDGKLLLDDTGNHYLKISFVSQFWLRSGSYNPGSTSFGFSKKSGTDIGIRRFRMLLFGQLTERVFFFSMIGENNFNNISDRKISFFVHDVYGEYAIHKTKLSLGIGLSGWSGLSRFASPSAATIMGLDAPLYQQTTNDVTDQFLRKLGVFAKGKLGNLDYRVNIAQPLAFQKSSIYSSAVTNISNFSGRPPNMQLNGYLQYQFKDQETNLTPYLAGTYHGKKNVLNLGAGIVYQKQAMWHLSDNKVDTIYTNLLQYSVDAFYDAPIGVAGGAISVYINACHLDYGPGYIRNLGVDNPVNGDADKNVINGGGFAFPVYGTEMCFMHN
ncbi:MAG: hypothetical protein IPO92_01220 [Saprospiraceae bacterium]|nr:hypothetical protein [Saprospiraceae bacterium]